MNTFKVVEQIGDCTFQVPGHDALDVALVAAVGPTVGSDEERECWVDGPRLAHPIEVGQQRPATN